MVFVSLSAAIVALLTSAGLIKVIISVAHRLHLFEETDHRRTHTGDIPFLGGIGIALGFFVAAAGAYLVFLHFHPSRAFPARYLAALLVAGFTMHVTGVVDDLCSIPALRKLGLQLLAAGIAISGGVVIDQVSVFRVDAAIPLGALSIPLTALWIVGVSNAVNLMDGMDGLAGGVSLIVSAALGLWALLVGNLLLLMLCSALVGALVGFLLFNLPPARVFMGDGGSLFLGFTLAVLPLVHGGGAPAPFVLPALFLLLIVPAADTLAAIIRRTGRGIPFYEPDREHIHHKLQDLGLSARHALLLICAVCVLGAAAATVGLFANGPLRYGIPLTLGISTGLAVWLLYSVTPSAGSVARAAPAESLSRLTPSAYRLNGTNGTSRGHGSVVHLSSRHAAAGNSPLSQAAEKQA